jgi:hypothetical protein
VFFSPSALAALFYYDAMLLLVLTCLIGFMLLLFLFSEAFSLLSGTLLVLLLLIRVAWLTGCPRDA